MNDYLFRGSLEVLDPKLADLLELEAERQYRKIILIPSESIAPQAVRKILSSVFQNIYAEGYPDEETRRLSEDQIFDYDTQLGNFRRYSDPRYYKGVEYADIIEELARRRCAETFAANGITPDEIYVNVQALSGAPANNAVYHALANPGDTIMGMNLLHGGHLTHGSPVNRSGKYFNVVSYTVDEETERINYETLQELANQNKPRFIIAGFTSYPWSVDWMRLRSIADSVGAYLFADISHVAGLVAAGVYPSPVGIADVITFTTHKSLCGPRGACIITTRPDLSKKIDRAIFPGEQGGPHVNVMAAIAMTFKLAQTKQFRDLQAEIVNNSIALTQRLGDRGLRIPYGGTDTHMSLLDCKSVTGPDGSILSGDQAARLLDIAGIVVNRNTIPGDRSAFQASGVRMGTPWVTQRGLKEADMIFLADAIADLLLACKPYALEGRKGDLLRTKVDFEVLEAIKLKVRDLAQKAGIDYEPSTHGYPHFFYVDELDNENGSVTFDLNGEAIGYFLNYSLTSDAESLKPGDSQPTRLYTSSEEIQGQLSCISDQSYKLTVSSGRQGGTAATWLRDLSDGFVHFDEDLLKKLPGPVSIKEGEAVKSSEQSTDPVDFEKPYFIGIDQVEMTHKGKPLLQFKWEENESAVKRTPLYETHRQLGAKMIPFAGWEMPVWYSSVVEEHHAVRQAAGLFDVAHMGVYQAEGPQAAIFLDSVVGNDVSSLAVGESLYTQFLTPSADVIDDLLVYRRANQKYLVVVNASNDDKDWAWLNAVISGEVMVDPERPWVRAFGRGVTLRNLRSPESGADMRVDIALQGPRSRDILLALGCDQQTRSRIMQLTRTQLCEGIVGGFDLVISRTGYTGEKMAFELFVHPDRSNDLFTAILKAGEPFGIKPCGLGARDSLRTEAGLPLYGHEMGGEKNLGVGEAGFGSYVKTHKPWFIGRKAFLARERERKGIVVRFRFSEKGVRMAHSGDPVLDKRGRDIGWVTSCAIDSYGYLTGQAFVDLQSSAEGNQIFIFQGAPKVQNKAPSDLEIGDRVNLPVTATIISRFPK